MASRAGRTYKRDGRGRFASTGTSGKKSRPPAKTVAKGVNKLTRDNAGKITSVGGDGATARGGRLKTAAGNLRATQTKRLKTMQGVSYEKPTARGSKALSSKLRPGEFARANLRPRNVMAKPKRQKNPYQSGKADLNYVISERNDDKKARIANAQTLKNLFEKQGFTVKYESNRKNHTMASYNPRTNQMTINRSHSHHVNPRADAIRTRRVGMFSSSSPLHVYYHEMGHAKDKNLSDPSKQARLERGSQMYKLARRVSKYAATNSGEFVAETYAGRRTGRKYDYQVMAAYRQEQGLDPSPIVRRLKKKTKK